MITLKLFYEFFKIGLFAIGGGLATIPFLYDLAEKTSWFSPLDISNMIAVSESTPGPIGINMATYAGFMSNNIIGGITATIGLVLPSIIIITVIAKFLDKFEENVIIKKLFYGLRAGVIALILISGINLLKEALISSENLIKPFESILFLAILLLLQKVKLHPIYFIIICGIIGGLFLL